MKSARAGITLLLCACFLAPGLFAQPNRATVTKLAISPENAALLQHLGEYSNLEVLSISCLEDLRSLPDSIGSLHKLKELRIDNGNGCSMNPLLPESVGNLGALEKLALYGAQDPREPNLQSGERHPFPKSLSKLKNLRYLDLGRNGLEEIPEFVGDLPKLRDLAFGWNMSVKKLPLFLLNLRELRTLRLDADGLKDLPDFLSQLPSLTLITLGDNCAITQSAARRAELQHRFPRIKLDFSDEYECPQQEKARRP